MTRNGINHLHLKKIWEFLRGDLEPVDFEQWLYSEPELEGQLGYDLYLETISANYSCKRNVYEIKVRLEAYARESSNLRCQCITLPMIADIGMGDDDEEIVFRTFAKRAERGEPFWWLKAVECRGCGQWWLVAEELRINDVYFLKRMSLAEVHRILESDSWPEDFDKYETLLRLGLYRGYRWRFDDPMARALRFTVEDLASERPGIKVSELAELLNLNVYEAEQLARKVIRKNWLTRLLSRENAPSIDFS